jgi:hypothetical protein
MMIMKNVGCMEYCLLGYDAEAEQYAFCLFGSEGGGSTFLQNISEFLPDYMATHLRIVLRMFVVNFCNLFRSLKWTGNVSDGSLNFSALRPLNQNKA